MRATAFDDFEIPVRVVQGHIRMFFYVFTIVIGHFALKIPFKSLYTEPVVAELDGLYILCVPRAGSNRFSCSVFKTLLIMRRKKNSIDGKQNGKH